MIFEEPNFILRVTSGIVPISPEIVTLTVLGQGLVFWDLICEQSLWTRTLDRYIRADLPECVVRASVDNNTGQITDKRHTHPIPGQKLKFPTPPGIEPGLPGWKAGTLPTTPRRWIYFVN